MLQNDGLAMSQHDGKGSLLELGLAKRIAESLMKHYPAHLWAVNADASTGMVDILNLGLSGMWGYRIRMSEIQDDPSDRLAVMGAGELLERYRISRGRLNANEYHDLKQDFAGQIAVDAS